MRHYTGKHGVLEAYLKEFLASQMEYKENLQFKGSLPPTNKIGCRRKRHKRHSSGEGEQDPTEAEDSTEDPAPPPSASSMEATTIHNFTASNQQPQFQTGSPSGRIFTLLEKNKNISLRTAPAMSCSRLKVVA